MDKCNCRIVELSNCRLIILSLEGDSAVNPPIENQKNDAMILWVVGSTVDAAKERMANAHPILVSATYKSGARATMAIRCWRNHSWNAKGGCMNVLQRRSGKGSERNDNSTFIKRLVNGNAAVAMKKRAQNEQPIKYGIKTVRTRLRIFCNMDFIPYGTFKKKRKPESIKNKGTAREPSQPEITFCVAWFTGIPSISLS